MIKLLLLFVILTGCGKNCLIETTVPVTFSCQTPEQIWSITIHFQQGERIVLADVVHGSDFKNGLFSWEYKFYDTDPDLMVWRVYNVDKKWIEYRTKL